MKTKDFSFELPENLIAQEPPLERGHSRLFVIDRVRGSFSHSSVRQLGDFLPEGALMIFNDTKVRKARLFGVAEATGGRVEFLLLKRISLQEWSCIVSKAKKQKEGKRFLFPEAVSGILTDEERDTKIIRFAGEIDEAYLERNGHMPLPPYIHRADSASDETRYQTIYARRTGSAAAPTAGLHFTEEILESLERKGITKAFITLHVGLGTFMPVRTEEVEAHSMHEEEYSVPEETSCLVGKAKAEGRSIVAVGTTAVRTLESAWIGEGDARGGYLQPGPGTTRIFIYPGYRFKVTDRLFTNFHTPESTLLMLVSAFAGRERILKAYGEAVRLRYRFFSYGDAMLIQ
jgi:S-adenosylmethionine:tRNA ribosyltransferase-isomerase